MVVVCRLVWCVWVLWVDLFGLSWLWGVCDYKTLISLLLHYVMLCVRVVACYLFVVLLEICFVVGLFCWTCMFGCLFCFVCCGCLGVLLLGLGVWLIVYYLLYDVTH